MKTPPEVKLMVLNPETSSHDLDGAAHEHAFVCRSRCPARKTPGKSSLFPTENNESSEWIVAWHAMKTIEKAMSINDQPVVVDFRVHKDAMVWPMVAAGTSNDEIMIARATAPDWDSQEL